MDCTLIIPTALAKFNHAVLSALLAVQLGASGEVGISCSWEPGKSGNVPPAECSYQAERCLDPITIWTAYAPTESDTEEIERKQKEAKLNDPVIKELLKRIEDLEKTVK